MSAPTLAPTPTPRSSAMYTKEGLQREFRQCEIITTVVQHIFDVEQNARLDKTIGFTIVLAQDCDLLRDYDARRENKTEILNGMLMYEMEPALEARAANQTLRSSDVWKRITQNNHERYHYLQPVSPESDQEGSGLPFLLVDFRRYFTLPPIELGRQIGLIDGARRRCRLDIPYREHLTTRAAFYFQRVGLPDVENN